MSDRDTGLQEWEAGLPAPEELMPLSQTLIPPDLALAFNIDFHARADVPKFSNAADDAIVARRLQPQASQTASESHACLPNPMQHNPMIPMLPEANALPPIKCLDHVVPSRTLNLWGSLGADQRHKVANLDRGNGQTADIMGLDTRVANDLSPGDDSSEGGSSKQSRRRVETDLEDVDSNFVGTEISNEDSTAVPRTLKRPRLVWTPQLHKRFVEAVAQLGIKHAVPKTIMQLMNVDGLTRENVASHLQKYRLYLKRMQGLSSECLSMQDHLFASPSLSLGLSGSPQLLPNHREDIMPFLMPVTAGSLGAGQIAEKLPFSLPNTEFSFNNGFPQPFTCQRMSQTHPFDGHTQQGSPQGQALKLFPATGT